MRRPPGLAAPTFPLEVELRDLGPCRDGNTGIPCAWSFESAVPGPHVMISALVHGNEPAGMWAVTRLLDEGARPARGRLSLVLANFGAYERLGPHTLATTRFLDRDLNRLWRDDWIDRDRTSREAARARELRPLVRTVDLLLDLHTTWFTPRPFWVLPDLPKARALCERIAVPGLWQLLPPPRAEGLHLIDYGGFLDPYSPKVALTLECGRHFEARSAETAYAAARRFLAVTGVADDSPDAESSSPERYVIVGPQPASTDDLVLTVSYDGFVPVRAGELVAFDGEAPVHALADGVILPPRPYPRAGETAFNWGRRAGGP
jgi:predicted deacylase